MVRGRRIARRLLCEHGLYDGVDYRYQDGRPEGTEEHQWMQGWVWLSCFTFMEVLEKTWVQGLGGFGVV